MTILKPSLDSRNPDFVVLESTLSAFGTFAQNRLLARSGRPEAAPKPDLCSLPHNLTFLIRGFFCLQVNFFTPSETQKKPSRDATTQP